MATVRVALEDKISLGKNSFSSVTISASVERTVDDNSIEEGIRETAVMVRDFIAEERTNTLEELNLV